LIFNGIKYIKRYLSHSERSVKQITDLTNFEVNNANSSTSYKNYKIKNSILDLMKNTPLLYIKSLSEITGCHIFAKCEYYLPYTSKDRMIKNIILDAKRYFKVL
jgi:hypothetical protein